MSDVSIWINAGERPSPHEEEDSGWWENLYEGLEFYDDVNGFQHLNKKLVIDARKKEIEYFKKMGVYTKVMRSEATQGGHKVISTKWIDTNKGDEKRPNYRSRFVGREIKRDKRMDLFAATPSLETLKFLIARCSQEQSRSDPWRLAVVDVRRAYFYAPAQRTIFIEIPKEDKNQDDHDKVGKLNHTAPGTPL